MGEVGIRPEFVETSREHRPGWNAFNLRSADHAGAYQVLTLESGDLRIKARVDDEFQAEEDAQVWVNFPPERIKVYWGGELVVP